MEPRFKKVQGHPKNDQLLAEVKDVKTRQEFRVVRLKDNHIGLVFADDDIISVPVEFFFMLARGIKIAESQLLRF